MTVLVALVAVLAVLIVSAYTQGPASVARLAAFESRQRLALGETGRAYLSAYLSAYLTRTRRFRAFGVVIAAIGAALHGTSTGNYRFDLDLMLCGWLAGGCWAEIGPSDRNRGGQAPQRRLAPRWLTVSCSITHAMMTRSNSAIAAKERVKQPG